MIAQGPAPRITSQTNSMGQMNSGNQANSMPDELFRRVQSQTARQVQDLRIDYDGSQVTVTGRSRTYYIKQLVTQAILDAVPAIRLANEIAVY